MVGERMWHHNSTTSFFCIMDLDPNIKPILVWVVHICITLMNLLQTLWKKDEGMDEQYKSLMYSYDIVHVIIFNSNYDFICLL